MISSASNHIMWPIAHDIKCLQSYQVPPIISCGTSSCAYRYDTTYRYHVLIDIELHVMCLLISSITPKYGWLYWPEIGLCACFARAKQAHRPILDQYNHLYGRDCDGMPRKHAPDILTCRITCHVAHRPITYMVSRTYEWHVLLHKEYDMSMSDMLRSDMSMSAISMSAIASITYITAII